MSKTFEQIQNEAEATRKTLREREDRALLKFAKLVFRSASFNGTRLPEQDILRVIADAASRSSSQSPRFAADLKLPGVENA